MRRLILEVPQVAAAFVEYVEKNQEYRKRGSGAASDRTIGVNN